MCSPRPNIHSTTRTATSAQANRIVIPFSSVSSANHSTVVTVSGKLQPSHPMSSVVVGRKSCRSSEAAKWLHEKTPRQVLRGVRSLPSFCPRVLCDLFQTVRLIFISDRLRFIDQGRLLRWIFRRIFIGRQAHFRILVMSGVGHRGQVTVPF